jgi:uncharacterized protein (DUF885 family)
MIDTRMFARESGTAEERLGARFDIREVHEWMIRNGSMPIVLLEQYVEEKHRRR